MTAADQFARLVEIMHRLREDCPWDRSQSHRTLRLYLLEETYEVLHALDEDRHEELCEELGDLLLQVIFHAEIAEEEGRFDIKQVLRRINEKLVRRHPHVFGEKEAETPAEVFRRWERIKTGEEQKPSALAGVPSQLPALARAARIVAKIRQAGLDPLESVDLEEMARRWLHRLLEAAAGERTAQASRAAGLLAVAVAEAAGKAGANAEDALRAAMNRLEKAFGREEKRLRDEGRSFDDLPDAERRRMARRLLREMEGA